MIGHTVHHCDTCESTQLLAKKLGGSHGTVFWADAQTQARGRQGKEWSSDKGGLWFSVILKPKTEAALWPRLTLVVGWALARALQQVGVPQLRLKWPNDIYVPGAPGPLGPWRKLGGVLLEVVDAETVIAGIGVNLNNPLPPPLVDIGATHSADIAATLDMVLRELSSTMDASFSECLSFHRAHSAILGNEIRYEEGEKFRIGHATDLTDEGGLRVESASGTIVLLAGEVFPSVRVV